MNLNKVKKNCITCEFYNSVCMGYGKRIDNGEPTYGMPIDDAIEMFPNGCEDWGISLGAYMEYVSEDKVYNALFL